MRPAKTRIATSGVDFFESVRWSHLLGQLDVILTKVRSPADAEDIRQLDSRRRSTAARNLAIERNQVLKKMDALGLPQSDEIGDQTNPMSVLIGTRNLEIELQVLAQAFEECAKATSVRAQPAIKNWLFKRSKIHQQQALFLSTL